MKYTYYILKLCHMIISTNPADSKPLNELLYLSI